MTGNRAFTTLPAADLAALLQQSKGSLQNIRMYHVGLEGDLGPVLAAVRELKTLRHFLAQCCRFHPDHMSKALAGLPLLESFIIVGHYFGEVRVSMKEMSQMVRRNNTLKILELNPMGNFEGLDDARAFFEAVSQSTSLKTLWCLSAFTDPYVKLVSQMMRENETLESFKLSVASGTSLIPIAAGLKVNNKLNELDIKTNVQPVAGDLECFIDALKESNMTVKTLKVANENAWDDEARTWVPVYHSQQVKELAKKLDFYLSLNGSGRQKLLADANHNATPEDWLEAIAHKKDVSEIFYFARRNPFICMPRSLGGNVPAPTPESQAKEKARQARMYSSLYSFGEMELRGLKHVQAALEDPNPRPVSKVKFHFPHGSPGRPAPVLQATDLAAIICKQPSSFTGLMFYFVKIEGDFNQVLQALRGRKSFQYFFAQGSQFDPNALIRTLWDLPSFHSLTLTWSEATMASQTTLLRKRPMKSLLVNGCPPASNKDIADFFAAAEESTHLEKLDCLMRNTHMTTAHVGYLTGFLRNHKKIQYLEIRVARAVSLVAIAKSLEHNKSLQRLTITIDGMNVSFPIVNRDDIAAFRDALATKNNTLKYLKVCRESWHGDHLWKPQYGRDPNTRKILQEIEDFLSQNAKGRALPLPGGQAKETQNVAQGASQIRGKQRDCSDSDRSYYSGDDDSSYSGYCSGSFRSVRTRSSNSTRSSISRRRSVSSRRSSFRSVSTRSCTDKPAGEGGNAPTAKNEDPKRLLEAEAKCLSSRRMRRSCLRRGSKAKQKINSSRLKLLN